MKRTFLCFRRWTSRTNYANVSLPKKTMQKCISGELTRHDFQLKLNYEALLISLLTYRVVKTKNKSVFERWSYEPEENYDRRRSKSSISILITYLIFQSLVRHYFLSAWKIWEEYSKTLIVIHNTIEICIQIGHSKTVPTLRFSGYLKNLRAL